MYKVFINDNSLSFSKYSVSGSTEEWAYKGKEQLWSLVGKLQEPSENLDYTILCIDVEKAWKEFCSLFTIIEAAGGLVKNPEDELLMIYRLGKWDLPKGKMEEGETAMESALREVQEECGIPEPKVKGERLTMYHTYKQDGEFILKKTYWFEMYLKAETELTPQKEEDIEWAVWASRGEVREYLNNTYASIRWLLKPFT